MLLFCVVVSTLKRSIFEGFQCSDKSLPSNMIKEMSGNRSKKKRITDLKNFCLEESLS